MDKAMTLQKHSVTTEPKQRKQPSAAKYLASLLILAGSIACSPIETREERLKQQQLDQQIALINGAIAFLDELHAERIVNDGIYLERKASLLTQLHESLTAKQHEMSLSLALKRFSIDRNRTISIGPKNSELPNSNPHVEYAITEPGISIGLGTHEIPENNQEREEARIVNEDSYSPGISIGPGKHELP